MRRHRSALVAGVVYLAAGIGWLGAAEPGRPWLSAWFLAVAIAGLFIPGPANQVPLARAYLAAPALVYGMTGQFGALAVVVAIAGLTDLVDGTVARRFGSPSQFGGALDPVVDG